LLIYKARNKYEVNFYIIKSRRVKMDISTFEEKAVASALFTAPVVGQDLKKFLDWETARIKGLALQALEEKIEHVYWVGAGNSRVNLMSGKELLDRFSLLPSDCYYSYEFIWRNPQRLNSKALVFLASYSGNTEDTVAAMRFAREKGAKTVAYVNQVDCLMGREADLAIPYQSKALFSLPLAAAFLFALEYARLNGNTECEAILEELTRVPDLLTRQYLAEKEPALELARSFQGQEMIYTLADGPLFGLGYKFGLTVFMENMRVNGSFMEAAEFRHGPAEMLDRHKPAFVILKGKDESRPLVERVISLLQARSLPMIVFDAEKYNPLNTLFDPFLLKIPLQWFAVYSAYLRGIYDLDERVLMGRGLMGQGKGVTWP